MKNDLDINIKNIFNDIKDKISLSPKKSDTFYVPNIIEFCESKKYLNLGQEKIKLYPFQKIILKTFYRGQKGNENIRLDETELDILRQEKMDQVIDKYNSGSLFRELVLVLGRRAGKDFLTSLIALYESMMILECPGGNPFQYYELASGNPICILTVATSGDQAKVLFNEIRTRIQQSEYFRNKIGKMESDRIFLLTPDDKEKNKKFIEAGLPDAVYPGSVMILSGHSNSDGLLGKRIFCCAKGSSVISSKGLLPIENFATLSGKINETLHGLEGMVTADYCHSNGIRNTLKIKMSSGNEIEITPEHKLYVWNDNGYFSFKKASELSIGDVIAGQYGQNLWGDKVDINDFSWSMKKIKYGDKIPCPICNKQMEQINPQHLISHGMTSAQFGSQFKGYPTRSDVALSKFTNKKDTKVPTHMSLELARLLGYFISEGNNTQNNINIVNTDTDVLKDIHYCMQFCFENIKFKKCTPDKNIRYKDRYVVRMFGRKEHDFFVHIGCNVGKAKDKEVPRIILESPKKYVASFIQAYFEGDGCVTVDRISATSVSKKLIYQIYYLLLNMGILCTIQYKEINKKNCQNQWLVMIFGENILKYEKQIGFISTTKKNKLFLLSQRISNICRKSNVYGFNIHNIVKSINKKNSEKQENNKEYGFYGFSNQKTQSLAVVKKWQNRYIQWGDKSVLDEIIGSNLFGDNIVDITTGQSEVFDFHVNSLSHSYCCNGLINHNSLLLDEVASFKSTGQLSGDRIYSALTPATADFKSPGKVKEGSITEENPEGLPIYDSKIISISSPRAEEGILYRMYKEAGEMDERLAFRAPTWKVNLKFTEASLRHEFKLLSAMEFNMEFGAEFSGTAGELFIPSQYVDDAVEIGRRIGLVQQLHGKPGMVYYAHLDPAASSHIYALVIIHIEERMRIIEKENGVKVHERVKMYVVDHIKTWIPTTTKSIKVAEIDEYVIDIAKRFRFVMVSYDAFNSISSIQKLRSKGIPSKLTEFRPKYKMKIYQHLEHLLVSHSLALPSISSDAQLLIQELKHLKRIYNATGFRIKPDPEAAVKTDDVIDGLVGACGTATETIYQGYAKGTTAYLPQSQSAGAEQWKVGRGVYNNQTWKNTFRR